MAINEELEQILKNSARDLPDDPSQSGWSTQQIKEKMYAFIPMLYDLIVTERGRITDLEEDGVGELGETVQAILNGNTAVGKALKDGDGNTIKLTYAKIEEILNGSLAVLKYLKEDGTSTEFIYKIEKDLATLSTTYANFLAACFNGNKAKNSENADYSEKAYRDDLGNVIKNTYATITSLNQTLNEVTKIKNGTTIVSKAQRDANNDIIHTTYLKIANIVNTASGSNDTNKPISAYAFKQLYDSFTTLYNYIHNGAANTSIDRLQEVFAFLTGHDDDETLTNLLAGKVNKSDIVDGLDSELSDKPVSAKQAYVLKGLIDAIVSGVTVVKEAEKATKDSDGNTIKATYVKSVGGVTPTNGNVDIANGLIEMGVVEDGDFAYLEEVTAGDFESGVDIEEDGDYTYLVISSED